MVNGVNLPEKENDKKKKKSRRGEEIETMNKDD